MSIIKQIRSSVTRLNQYERRPSSIPDEVRATLKSFISDVHMAKAAGPETFEIWDPLTPIGTLDTIGKAADRFAKVHMPFRDRQGCGREGAPKWATEDIKRSKTPEYRLARMLIYECETQRRISDRGNLRFQNRAFNNPKVTDETPNPELNHTPCDWTQRQRKILDALRKRITSLTLSLDPETLLPIPKKERRFTSPQT